MSPKFLNLIRIFVILNLFEANPNNLTLLANCARLEEARGEIGEAEKVFEKILGLDPVNQEALCVLAASKYYKDEPMKCLSLYRRALQTGKPCSALYNNLALASIATGQVDVAFRCYSKALQEISSDEDAEQIWYNIGNTCILIGEHQLAQQGLSHFQIEKSDICLTYSYFIAEIFSLQNFNCCWKRELCSE